MLGRGWSVAKDIAVAVEFARKRKYVDGKETGVGKRERKQGKGYFTRQC